MTAELNKVLGTVQQAIEIEKFGYEFYTNMRTFVKNKDGHKLISRLANLEIDHIKWLENEYNRQFDNLESFHEESASTINISLSGRDEIFFKDKLPEIFREFNAVKALDFAIEIENKSVEFYQKNIEITDNEELKDLFKRLADFEKDHIKVLNDTKRSLETDDSWITQSVHILW